MVSLLVAAGGNPLECKDEVRDCPKRKTGKIERVWTGGFSYVPLDVSLNERDLLP